MEKTLQLQRLILGAGPRWPKVRDDQYHDTLVDIREFSNPGHEIDVVADLNEDFPFDDNSFDEISAIHLVEHLNSLIHFMNECHRVLRQGGKLYIETPLAGGDPDLEFADPTHIRCYRIHSFANYFLPAGVKAFGYTQRAWTFIHLSAEHSVLRVEGIPIK